MKTCFSAGKLTKQFGTPPPLGGGEETMSVYADDTTFFLKHSISIKSMVDTFHFFSDISGLKSNLSKCEITGIGVLIRVQVVCVV